MRDAREVVGGGAAAEVARDRLEGALGVGGFRGTHRAREGRHFELPGGDEGGDIEEAGLDGGEGRDGARGGEADPFAVVVCLRGVEMGWGGVCGRAQRRG